MSKNITSLIVTTKPGVTHPTVTVQVDGVTTQTTDSANVTTSATYDAYQRPVTQTDGRGNTTTQTYNALGQLWKTTDAAGAETTYTYDTAGRVASVTNALGNVITYGYDVRGNKTYEGGATYPVTYAYDLFGQKTQMVTYREEDAEEATGDVTTLTYDEATGALIAKTYADGHGVTYTLTDKGQVATRTDARGKVTTYTYDVYGSLLSQDYSDTTPDITYTYDTLGRQATATDAVGTTTFAYNVYGELESESVTGVYNKTLIRYYDTYGRDVGYTIDGTRTLVKEYDTATGRISRAQMGGGWFEWDYLTGTNLKSQLTYPNGAKATWTYEPTCDLLTSVTNQVNSNVISAYAYTNDVHGRRTSISKSGTMMEGDEIQPYTYNTRDELISGQGLTYDYDDIGNRIEAEGRDYTTNNLNQYTAIDTFTPTYDLDGNQTTIQTSTGVWTVEYNAENRPIRWTQGDIVIEMAYDRMGRRIVYHETRNGSNYINAKFVYNGYLCIQRLYGGSNGVYQSFVWDPTEQVATRPLCMQVPSWGSTVFYMHDGNKNVSDVIYYAVANGIAAHYDYAPFGAVTRTASNTRMTGRDFIGENPFRFSSEYHDNTLGLIHYSNRHYIPLQGHFACRDTISNYVVQEYIIAQNNLLGNYDYLGYTSFTFEHTLPLGPFPIPMLHVSLVGALNLSGTFEECKMCNDGIPEIHFYTKADITAELGIRAGISVNDGINSSGKFVHQEGKNDAKKGRYRDITGKFAKKPSTDVLKDVLGLHLDEQNFVPATMQDWERLPVCPQDSTTGTLSMYVQGRASVFGFGAKMDFTWQLLPREDSSLWPNFDGDRGFIGGGTALYIEAGIRGSLTFVSVY